MKIWDLPTRLYHWLQALVFTFLLISGLSGNGPHIQLGIFLLGLVIWRLMWGVFGSETSRFSQFVKSPKTIYHYLTTAANSANSAATAGHNPLGAVMVIGLLALLITQCFSGLVLAGVFDDLPYAQIFFNDAVLDIIAISHWFIARILMALILIHILAIVIYKLNNKPLLKAMITGRNKRLQLQEPIKFASNIRALLLLISAGLVTIAIIATPTLYSLYFSM